MWQKCPICNGTGRINHSTDSINPCDVCHGKKIISEITGLPPSLPVIKDHRTEPYYSPPFNPNKDIRTNDPTFNFPPPTYTGDFRDGGYETQQEYFGK